MTERVLQKRLTEWYDELEWRDQLASRPAKYLDKRECAKAEIEMNRREFIAGLIASGATAAVASNAAASFYSSDIIDCGCNPFCDGWYYVWKTCRFSGAPLNLTVNGHMISADTAMPLEIGEVYTISCLTKDGRTLGALTVEDTL